MRVRGRICTQAHVSFINSLGTVLGATPWAGHGDGAGTRHEAAALGRLGPALAGRSQRWQSTREGGTIKLPPPPGPQNL